MQNGKICKGITLKPIIGKFWKRCFRERWEPLADRNGTQCSEDGEPAGEGRT